MRRKSIKKVATLAVANDENDSNTEYSPEKVTISSDVYASFAIKDQFFLYLWIGM